MGTPIQVKEDIKKVLWISRHRMDEQAKEALGKGIFILQHPHSLRSAEDVKEKVEWADIICTICPAYIQQQLLDISKGKPVIRPVFNRVPTTRKNYKGETIFEYNFKEWEQVISMKSEFQTYDPNKVIFEGAEEIDKLKFFSKKQARALALEVMEIVQNNIGVNSEDLRRRINIRIHQYCQAIDKFGGERVE